MYIQHESPLKSQPFYKYEQKSLVPENIANLVLIALNGY
jgi:hypothetical protein